ncbi:MAG: Na+/H+ antiporter [Gammaproteobacteria bacterium]|nr:Na+/H+ antiporter [Gammaproteobacteria bacterium]
MSAVTLVLLLLLAVAVSRILVRLSPFKLPLPLLQIAMGAGLAFIGFDTRLDPHVFFLIFIPPLLFLDGWRIPKDALRDNWRSILTLALGLVLFTVAGLGYLIHAMIPSLSLAMAFAVAAIISPTDPVAVSAITSGQPVPSRLLHILEGESLFNDASGLVCFNFAVMAVITGHFSIASASLSFLKMAAGGIVIGVAIAWGASAVYGWLARWVGEEPGTPVLVSILIPFAAYLAAEELGMSGILAAVAAGIAVHYANLVRYSSAVARMRRSSIWEMLEVTLNGTIFVLLGQQLPGVIASVPDLSNEMHAEGPLELAVYVVVITAALAVLRFVWSWFSLQGTNLLSRLRGKPTEPVSTRAVIFASLAGVKGAITLAGVLTLPVLLADGSNFLDRDFAIFVAMGVIILSLAVASATLPIVARGFDTSESAGAADHEKAARQAAGEAGLHHLETALRQALDEDSRGEVQAVNRVIEQYRGRLVSDDRPDHEARSEARVLNEERRFKLSALAAEREELYRLRRAGKIEDTLHRRLVHEIDLAETALSSVSTNRLM